jgi:signal transduction histidine kinase
MFATAGGGAVLAAFLLRRAQTAPGAAALGAFLALTGVWSLGLLGSSAWGAAALALAPAAAAVFVQFATQLTGLGRRLVPWSYALGTTATAAGLTFGAGRYLPLPGGGIIFRYEGAGLFGAGATLALAGAGYWLLFSAWKEAQGQEKRQLAATLAASLLGLGAAAGLAFPVFGIEAFPWPLLVTPAYLALLAYGVLKHELLADQERVREAAARARLAELGALAATVAHDLRNPLNIIGMAAASCEPALREEIRVQIWRMEALVRDLLDYAKPWRAEPQMIEAGPALREACRNVEAKVEAPGGVMIWADPLRLHQALVNLIANARSGGGRIAIFAERETNGVAIHVCDDGPGVPEAIRDTLFQPFVSRGTSGTGLGLAIVARVMEAHGGTAALSARPGWTTCFTLKFPSGRP